MIDAAQMAIDGKMLSPQFGSAYYELMERALGSGTPEMNTYNQ
jgi:hypothetical protein